MIRRKSMFNHPHFHRFTHLAMATVFEILLFHEDGTYSHQAAAEAFRILDALDFELSRFNPNGDIGRINALSLEESAVVGVESFSCLKRGLELGAETGGCFDIFIGSLKDARPDARKEPGTSIGASVGTSAGFRADFRKPGSRAPLELSEKTFTVRVSERVTIDLGAFGKGYAVDRMAESLREWDIESALVHGGRSSVFAAGRMPDGSGWRVTASLPGDRGKILKRFELQDRAMGASGLEKGSHIFDPGTGEPVRSRMAAWVLGPDAAVSDALSTAFMVMTQEEVRLYCSSRPELSALVLEEPAPDTGAGPQLFSVGMGDL
jgi:FAD:protein FMN transferase